MNQKQKLSPITDKTSKKKRAFKTSMKSVSHNREELKLEIIKLLEEGYTLDAVSYIKNKRKDAIGSIFSNAIVNGEIKIDEFRIGILKKLPAELVKQFNILQDVGPYRVEKRDNCLIIMPW